MNKWKKNELEYQYQELD